MANVLTELLYDDQFGSHHEHVQELFADEYFKRTESLPVPERAQNSYAMLGHVVEKLGKTGDTVGDPRLLLAFYEWSCVHAPGLLPLTTPEFTFGRMALPAAAVASARASVLIFARYVQAREIQAFRSHRRPMLELQNVRRSLFGALATAYACTFLANTMKAALVQAHDLSVSEVQLDGIVARSYLVTSAQKVAQECRERCGAHGVFSANRIADYLGMFQELLTAEGDIQVLRLRAARHLLSSARYSPPRIGASDFAGLDDEPTWLDLFRAREGYYYERTAKGNRNPSGGTAFGRRNRTIPDAMALADAYAKRRALESFLDAVQDAPDAASRTALHLTAKLFVLDYVITHSGPFFLAEGHITRPTSERLDSEYMAVCQQLADYLPLLVDAFAIDEDILNVPITSDDRIGAWEERSQLVAHLR